MVALQIRDVPDEVRDVLAERAQARGQSLQAFLLSLVEEEASRSRNLAVLQRFAGRSDGVADGEADGGSGAASGPRRAGQRAWCARRAGAW